MHRQGDSQEFFGSAHSRHAVGFWRTLITRIELTRNITGCGAHSRERRHHNAMTQPARSQLKGENREASRTMKPYQTELLLAIREIFGFYTAANASAAVANDAPSNARSLIKNCPASPNTGKP